MTLTATNVRSVDLVMVAIWMWIHNVLKDVLKLVNVDNWASCMLP